MGKLDANGVKLEEDEDREKMVDDDDGGEAGGGEQRLLPVAHLEEDGVQADLIFVNSSPQMYSWAQFFST